MGSDAVVVRHSASGAPHRLAALGRRAAWSTPATAPTSTRPRRCWTPTRSGSRLGRLEGLRVAIVGDVLHSRVARSNVRLLHTLGAEVTLVAPPTLLPVGVGSWPAEVTYDLDAVLPKADVVMMLRVQARADERLVLPQRARVQPPLRPGRPPDGRAARRRDRHAPRPDEPRHGDRRRGGRLGALDHRRAGRATASASGWPSCTCCSGGRARA